MMIFLPINLKKRKFNNATNIKKSAQPRSVQRHKLLVRNDDGSLSELTPEDTLWYLKYVETPPWNDRLKKQFRNRFRMPYQSFIDLHKSIDCDPLFNRWGKTDTSGHLASNTKLLLLGTLRYIGRSWTLNDLEEANGISREVNRVFLHTFIIYGSTVLYKKWVLDPVRNMNVSSHEKLFKMAGFNGCIGSTDATHVGMLNYATWAHIIHKGFKLNIPSRTYNMTVNHCHQILGSTLGHPATWNDKTLILFDELVSNVNDGIIPNNYEFMLYEHDKEGNIVEVAYKGV